MHGTLQQDRMYVTVDIQILTVREGRLGLLLGRREYPPYPNRWALPGRFVELDESAEAATRRLLDEMLPTQGAYLEQLYTFTAVDRDPRGRVLSTAYLAIVPWRRLEPVLGQEGMRLSCFDVRMDERQLILSGVDGTELAGEELAFDHGRIVRTGIQRLRGKIDYTDIGFRFLDDDQAFPLSALTAIYEAVLDKDIDDSNFRRSLRSRYEETGRLVQTSMADRRRRGRPAALYRLVEYDGGGIEND